MDAILPGSIHGHSWQPSLLDPSRTAALLPPETRIKRSRSL